MSEQSEQNAPERCSCCTCGYTWVKGQYGGHSCADQLLARVAELEAERDRFQRSAHVNWNEFSEALKQQSAVDERAAFQEWYATPEAFKAGDSNGWSGIAWAAWQKRAALSAPSHGEQVRVEALLSISRKILAKLQHPTASVHAGDMWNLEDALKLFDAAPAAE